MARSLMKKGAAPDAGAGQRHTHAWVIDTRTPKGVFAACEHELMSWDFADIWVAK